MVHFTPHSINSRASLPGDAAENKKKYDDELEESFRTSDTAGVEFSQILLLPSSHTVGLETILIAWSAEESRLIRI